MWLGPRIKFTLKNPTALFRAMYNVKQRTNNSESFCIFNSFERICFWYTVIIQLQYESPSLIRLESYSTLLIILVQPSLNQIQGVKFRLDKKFFNLLTRNSPSTTGAFSLDTKFFKDT